MGIRKASLVSCAAVAMAATPVAAETWICSQPDRTAPVIVAMNGELRIGEPANSVRHAVLQDDEIAVMAVHHGSVTHPQTNAVVLVVTTVMIDKRTNKSVFTIARSDGEIRQLTGRCRGYDEGLENSSPIISFFPH